MDGLWTLLAQFRWNDAADIALVSYIVYKLLVIVKGTRAMNMLGGLLVIFALLAISHFFDLLTVNWVINSFLSYLILILIILFQSDIRRALTRIGRGAVFSVNTDPGSTLEEVVRAAEMLASKRTGGLFVLERKVGLAEYVERGTRMDALVSRQLLVSIFQTSGPLHDGAVVITGDRIEAARVVLPLSASPQIKPRHGTRHRAALGLAEESDAVCVVVSEERGQMSVAVGDTLIEGVTTDSLRNLLLDLFEVGRRLRRRLFHWRPRA